MILLIDNYDSFTFNLYQYLAEIGKGMSSRPEEVKVVRNDRITLGEAASLAPDRLVISPGPGRPEKAGIIVDLIRESAGRLPILGVCLGHQAIGIAFGGKIHRAKRLMHGKVSAVTHDGKGIFTGIGNPFTAIRYHSLALDEATLPPDLEVSARSEDGEIMGIRHRRYSIEGVQFHPESILTPEGKSLLTNFLKLPVEERK
ncbi:MAG: aminodeoxychorismate/anthranilate synthase component II [bacterium]|nr:aminodeoxychorismate/anthranilate synthase component II [bacterium]